MLVCHVCVRVLCIVSCVPPFVFVELVAYCLVMWRRNCVITVRAHTARCIVYSVVRLTLDGGNGKWR